MGIVVKLPRMCRSTVCACVFVCVRVFKEVLREVEEEKKRESCLSLDYNMGNRVKTQIQGDTAEQTLNQCLCPTIDQGDPKSGPRAK